GPAAARANGLAGGATRGHIAILDQQAYVRDFDVEIAANALIADPKIDVLHSGVVLDVTVAAVTPMRLRVLRAYRKSIASLAGDDPGRDPEGWAAWLADHKDLAAAAERLPVPARLPPAAAVTPPATRPT